MSGLGNPLKRRRKGLLMTGVSLIPPAKSLKIEEKNPESCAKRLNLGGVEAPVNSDAMSIFQQLAIFKGGHEKC
jgi:hypothetical protein